MSEQAALPLDSAPPSAPSSSAPPATPAPAASAPATTSPQPTPSSTPAPAASPPPEKPARPDGLPDRYWDAATGIKVADFVKDHNELAAFKAQEDSRKLTLPQRPEDYTLGLPKEFKAPDGIEYVPNPNDPLLPQARAFAQKYGLSVDAFHELMGLHAAGQIGTQQSIAAAKQAEVDKLGATGTARKTAVDTWLASIDPQLGKHFSGFIFTAPQVQFVEKLMERFRTQGGGSFNQGGQQPPSGNGSIPGYANMSFEQRRDAQERLRVAPSRAR